MGLRSRIAGERLSARRSRLWRPCGNERTRQPRTPAGFACKRIISPGKEQETEKNTKRRRSGCARGVPTHVDLGLQASDFQPPVPLCRLAALQLSCESLLVPLGAREVLPVLQVLRLDRRLGLLQASLQPWRQVQFSQKQPGAGVCVAASQLHGQSTGDATLGDKE